MVNMDVSRLVASVIGHWHLRIMRLRYLMSMSMTFLY